MSLQQFFFEYTYTKPELKRAFFHTKIFAKLLAWSLLFLVSAAEVILPLLISGKTFGTLKIVFTAIFVPLAIISLVFLILTTLRIQKQSVNLQGIQKLHFENESLILESGTHFFKIETKYILRIKASRCFYHLRLAITGTDEAARLILISPLIPRRITDNDTMRRLANLLRVDFINRA